MQTQTNNTRKLRYSTLPTEPDAPQDAYPATMSFASPLRSGPSQLSIAAHVSGMLQANRHELKPQPFTELLDTADSPNYPKPDLAALHVGVFVEVQRHAPRDYKLHSADEHTITIHDALRNRLIQWHRSRDPGENYYSYIKPGRDDKLAMRYPYGHAHAYLIELTKITDTKLTGFIRGHSEGEIDPVDQLAPVTFKPSEVFEVLSPEQARKELPET